MAKPLPKGLWKRGRTYYSNFRHQGRKIRERLGTDRRTAEKKLLELRARLERGDYGLLDGDYPWDSLKGHFLTWARQSVRSHGDYARDIRIFEQFAKPVNVREVGIERILAYRQWRLGQAGENGETITPRTVNREVATIKNMLNKGVKMFKVIGGNPIADLKPLEHSTPKKNRRPLEPDEILRFFDESPAHLLSVWRMFACTGIREDELVSMLFDDIDFEAKICTVRAANAKSKKSREIPLDDELLAMIAKLRDEAKYRQPVEGNTPKQTAQQAANFSRRHVFVTQANTPHRNNLLRKFYAIAKRAGIEGAHQNGTVDIHSLRGSFITIAISHGASPKDVQEIVGHSTLAMTMNVYAKANDGSKRDAIGKLPFATVSSPEHIVKMRETGTNRAQVERSKAQPKTPQRIA